MPIEHEVVEIACWAMIHIAVSSFRNPLETRGITLRETRDPRPLRAQKGSERAGHARPRQRRTDHSRVNNPITVASHHGLSHSGRRRYSTVPGDT